MPVEPLVPEPLAAVVAVAAAVAVAAVVAVAAGVSVAAVVAAGVSVAAVVAAGVSVAPVVEPAAVVAAGVSVALAVVPELPLVEPLVLPEVEPLVVPLEFDPLALEPVLLLPPVVGIFAAIPAGKVTVCPATRGRLEFKLKKERRLLPVRP